LLSGAVFFLARPYNPSILVSICLRLLDILSALWLG
jgi:hypothetical protein